jgi:lysophospholipid acyltransferase (LPLAT)-like uncharacterized protein
LINAIGHTLKWRTTGLQNFESIQISGSQPILGFWHGRILAATFYFKQRGIVVITSQNFDGEWIARIIERFGYKTARGSTSRGALRAMSQLVKDVKRGCIVGFTLDGPRGPARVAKPGAAWLAKKTGNPVLPFHIEASNCWTLRSWDNSQIPKPFSTVALVVGDPITVPTDASPDILEEASRKIEAHLEELEKQAKKLLLSSD